MANIFEGTPTYITIQEVRDTTTKTGLTALTNQEITVLITKAQDIIDNYIGSYGTKFDDTQKYIFPIIKDGDSYLPDDIKKATFYVVEQLFESGDLISGAVSSSSGSGVIVSERTGDRTITYDVGNKTTTTNNKLKFLGIPPEAESILNKYRQIFFKNVI